ncbi:MAG: polysaccharide deacetylase family protein [Bdellovibrionaceae bacterium]|nr:polysaccharide deacetylase family protein [Pseudobdellovibrionaceae bacterium]
MTNFITFLLLVFSISTHAAEMNELLQKSINAHETAESYLDWDTSPYNPHQIFAKYDSLHKKQEIAPILCEAIDLLSPEERSIFYSELSQWTLEQDLPCLSTVLIKTKVYYDFKSAHLYLNFYIQNMGNKTFQDSADNLLGPSRSESINTIGGPVFYYGERGGLGKKELALTFDDGPHPTLTLELLDILKRENIQATFFTVGKNVKSYPHIASEIVKQGHTLGTHTYSHQNLPKLSLSSAYAEINSGFDSVLIGVGSVAPFFRFPYGSKNKTLSNFVKQSDLASFFWDIDTLDWKKKNPEVLLNFVLKEIESTKNGIVLFHDIQPQTIAIMPTLLAELKMRGYKLVVYTPTEWLIQNGSRLNL